MASSDKVALQAGVGVALGNEKEGLQKGMEIIRENSAMVQSQSWTTSTGKIIQ